MLAAVDSESFTAGAGLPALAAAVGLGTFFGEVGLQCHLATDDPAQDSEHHPTPDGQTVVRHDSIFFLARAPEDAGRGLGLFRPVLQVLHEVLEVALLEERQSQFQQGFVIPLLLLLDLPDLVLRARWGPGA